MGGFILFGLDFGFPGLSRASRSKKSLKLGHGCREGKKQGARVKVHVQAFIHIRTCAARACTYKGFLSGEGLGSGMEAT